MSLHNLAQNMAAHGRNGDSMLMHVTPDEVQGLQQLAMANGGSLSINPHTGLPEANIFSQAWKYIKPVAAPLAGAGLMMIPGMQPLAAAALVGGVGALGTGSLKKGLMAGLSAYGGAGLAGGLSAAGNVAGVESAAQEVAKQGLTGTAAETAMAPSVSALNANATPTLSSMGQGLGRLATDPLSTTQLIGSGAQGSGTLAGAAKIGSVAAPLAAAAMTPEPFTPQAGQPGTIRPAVLTRTQIPESQSPRNGSAERRWFNDQWSYPAPYTAANGGMIAFNQGGLGTLGGYSDGGRLLRGPGDGVSDSIPATIGDRQPARLADGEFVVPARIVSEIGNGSTEAGARKLYAMMDRVQKARRKTVGKDRVAANTKADRYLPA